MSQSFIYRIMSCPHWAFRLGIFLAFFSFLHFFCGDILYRLFWNGFFATNSIYVHEVVDHTGGALRYLSQFIHQVLYYPALGPAALAGMLVAIAYLCEKCFELKSNLFTCTFLPSILLLSLYSGVGYDIYMRIDASFGMTSMLGCLITLLLYLLYLTSDNLKWGRQMVTLLTAVLYPSLGFYALAALSLMSLNAWLTQHAGLFEVSVTAVVALFFPFLFDVCLFGDEYGWGAEALLLSSSYLKLRVLQLLSVALLVIIGLIRQWDGKSYKWSLPFQMGILLIGVALSYLLAYKDVIYFSELKASRLTDEGNYEDVIVECRKHKTLSRTLNTYRVIALANTGKLSNSLFKVDFPFVENAFSPNEHLLFEDVISFHAGFLNNTTRSTIETWQRFSFSYRRACFLAYCALLKDEKALAIRYMDQLRQSFVMKEEVRKMELLMDDKNAFMTQFPDFALVAKRMPKEDVLFIGGASLSRCFLCFSDLPEGSYELRLMSDLWEKNLNAFSMDLPSFIRQTDKPIAQCVKEAAVIASMNGGNQALLSYAQVDRETWNKVNDFFSALKVYKRDEIDRARKDLKSMYGKTYCYYYVFGNLN